jgi:hypothetical protein
VGRRGRALVVALALLLGGPSVSWAQSATPESGVLWAQAATPQSSGATPAAGAPRFPGWGPAAAPPDSEGPARANSVLPPGRTARCRWDLAGVWEGRGQQTDPSSNSYNTRLVVQQYGNYLTAQQPADGITYYGVCSGDRVELDAYSGDTYVGAQTGTVSGNGRRIETTWVLYRPDYAAGYETLTASGRPSR